MESCVLPDASRLGNDLCVGGCSPEALRNHTLTGQSAGIKVPICQVGRQRAARCLNSAPGEVAEALGVMGSFTLDWLAPLRLVAMSRRSDSGTLGKF
jgi:hypothetical protein